MAGPSRVRQKSFLIYSNYYEEFNEKDGDNDDDEDNDGDDDDHDDDYGENNDDPPWEHHWTLGLDSQAHAVGDVPLFWDPDDENVDVDNEN